MKFTQKKSTFSQRLVVLLLFWGVWAVAVVLRLAYWQLWKGSTLRLEALQQYERTQKQTASRGRILTSDGYELAGNETVYRVFAEPPLLTQSPELLASVLTPPILSDDETYQLASESAVKELRKQELFSYIQSQTQRKGQQWVPLKARVSEQTKKFIESLQLPGIGFEPYLVRRYPEASLAAHVTGFVGKDSDGEDIGYFGIEGALNRELKGVATTQTRLADALGLRLFSSKQPSSSAIQGRDVTVTIRRDVQQLAESMLVAGVNKYGAKSGEVVIMNPKTGDIMALAAVPDFEQKDFHLFEPSSYKNPTLASLYEPGSTFKTLTVAAGLDAGVISPETQCPRCDGPVTIGKFTIKTWNDEYHPNITMTDALAKSDNTAMIYIAQELGKDKFVEYIKKFGIGEELHLDLQEDTGTPMREKWGDIDLATNSFGQGILTNSLQMMRAVSTIANGGVMMKPRIIASVGDPSTGELIENKPVIERQVISQKAALEVTKMMVAAASSGEAKWIASKTHTIAGKTGTSQVASSEGGYDESKTIASFIGFAPAQDPQFIMIVKLVEPQSSIWAAETAAPLWYSIANKLFLLLSIPPGLWNETASASAIPAQSIGD